MSQPLHNGRPVAKRVFTPAEHTVFWRLMRMAAAEQYGESPRNVSFDATFPHTLHVLGQAFTFENFSRRTNAYSFSHTYYYALRPGEALTNDHAWLIQIHKYEYLDSSEKDPINGFLHGDETAYLRDMTMLRTALC